MPITFSEEELNDLLWAWAAITLAFAIVLTVRGAGLGFTANLIVTGLTVGIAFLFHELGHKIVAQKYGCWAEFRKFTLGLILALAMSFMGFIIAAPGAVMISGFISREQNGKIAVAGPLVNIGLAILFFMTGIFLPQIIGELPVLLGQIVFYGFFINAWLALFNMIPFPPLDGSKVMAWSSPVWLGTAALAGLMVFFM